MAASLTILRGSILHLEFEDSHSAKQRLACRESKRIEVTESDAPAKV